MIRNPVSSPVSSQGSPCFQPRKGAWEQGAGRDLVIQSGVFRVFLGAGASHHSGGGCEYLSLRLG